MLQFHLICDMNSINWRIKQPKIKKRRECFVLCLFPDTTTNTCWIYDDALIDNICVVLSWIGVLFPAARIWPNFMVHDVSLENEIRDKHQNELHNHGIYFKLRQTAYHVSLDWFSSRHAFIFFINKTDFQTLIISFSWYAYYQIRYLWI